MSPSPRVSVIMRSKNSAWIIGEALEGLFSQEFKDFELLVVDSGSTDRTIEIVRPFPCRLVEIEARDYYPGAVLNMAIEQARGEIIVFQNSDAVPLDAHALGRLVAAFDDPAVQAAFARQVPRPDAASWVRRDYAASFPPAEPNPPWITLSLPLAAMRKSVWQEHPFYTMAWASEDTEWGCWARRNGRLVRYVPDAVVMHSHNYTLRQLYGRRFVEGEADAFIYGGRVRLPQLLMSLLRRTVGDLAAEVRSGDWRDLAQVLPRSAVYTWAYYKGRRLGQQRAATGNRNAAKGQQEVLSRYEK